MSGASEAHRGIKGVIAALGRAFERSSARQARAMSELSSKLEREQYGSAVRATRRQLRGVLPGDFMVPIAYRAEDVTAMSEMPAPRHGSADARIYAFAKLMFDEVGPDEASRLADRYVAFTQQLIRPWPHEG